MELFAYIEIQLDEVFPELENNKQLAELWTDNGVNIEDFKLIYPEVEVNKSDLLKIEQSLEEYDFYTGVSNQSVVKAEVEKEIIKKTPCCNSDFITIKGSYLGEYYDGCWRCGKIVS